ncbi:alkaline phosphatase [Alteromonas mediterranea]|jgi:membrane protein YqaA with SNARE-associated domain|uniref:Alkaline phosphatase n=2 Tax=Alteromonas mediterranea TaxID=314275 RepID=A0AAC9JFE8_9ALTE|nr:VTT domain-containing protein [Alteromonas mediterranea]AEB00173.1 alkaline phosphatase [Alteromonas mediterranea DE]AFV87490.1 DedA family protein [Alteromonas mediterranea DE1]AGP99505.1 DedA family protein [Alteromonas mediterranea UM7]AGQ03663.1 DedA family protein [Alteromonas mediterranea UM4b]AMJ80358.1 alkaline phosphatase [Alteromonas mediterranea]|tara:strand:+ start:677 stop:1264 length:588 start_codon:yes stop_codon:yes gene_type:complete
MALGKKVKHKTKKLIDSKHMLKGITLASFLESTIVPIPLEAVMVPLMQARRESLWKIAFMATLGCVIGAVFGYALGYYLFDMVGEWLINTFFSQDQFDNVKQQMQNQGFWFVMTLGIAPIPFQVAMLAAGATKFSLPLFLLATVIARAIRYFGLAIVVYYAGDKAEQLIKRYKMKAVVAITLAVIFLWWLSNALG